MRRLFALLAAASLLGACNGGESGESGTTTSVPTGATSATTSPSTTAVPTTVGPTTTATSPSTTTVPEGGGRQTGPLEDADVQIETEEGTIQIGVAEVPAGVSGDFPIPSDLDVQLSSATDTDFGFSGVSAMTVAELAEFYASALPDAGYEITDRQQAEGVLAVYSFERAGEQGQVAISSAPGGTGSSVLVTIGDGSSRTEVSGGD